MRQTLERILVWIARRLEEPVQDFLARSRIRARLRRRALRAWHGTNAPLIVCYGSINRSPFAAALAQSRGRTGAHAAGFYPQDGRPAPPGTIVGAVGYGVDLSPHRSRRLTRAEVRTAPAIFVFDLQSVARLTVLDPLAIARTHLLGSLDDDPGVIIADPHGRGEAVLDQTLARIARAVEHAEAGS
jgi:protein-tyrosine phosphatase